MLRKLMFVMFALVCSGAHAEWSRISYFDQGDFYIDRATIARVGDHREVWSMLDYRSPKMDSNGKIYRSSRSMLQFQCENKMARAIHMSFYSGSMLRGNEISKMGSLKEWAAVPPDTPIREILRVVCAN
jgi:hypothetical protein